MNGNSGPHDSDQALPEERTFEPESSKTKLHGNSNNSEDTDRNSSVNDELSITLSELKSESGTGEQPAMDPSKLSDQQRETLRAIHEYPTATQEEIADYLDVSRATISKRVNSINGFEWKRRRAFVEQLYDGPAGGEQYDEQSRAELKPTVEELTDRVAALETQVEIRSADESPSFGPEMIYRIIHACMDAEYFSQEEELRVIRKLLNHE